MMLYSQDVSKCSIVRELEQLPEQERLMLEKSIALICEDSGVDFSPALSVVKNHNDLPELRKIAKRFQRDFTDVVILGTGGSSLGGKSLCALTENKSRKPNLHFVDNVDPVTFSNLFEILCPKNTGLIVISKSGDTSETLAQINLFIQWFQAKLTSSQINTRVIIITQQRASILRQIAIENNFTILDHDSNIGGRFSVFSLVGILPALIAGLDVVKFREGAAITLRHTKEKRVESEPAKGAILKATADKHEKFSVNVLVLYSDQLFWFGQWYRQLWAESIGKCGHGMIPVPFMGTVDQHSQLQLHLDGPSDKLFSILMHDCKDTGMSVSASATNNIDLGSLEERTLGELLNASQCGTVDALIDAGRPVRVLKINDLNERTLGSIMMHFMLETIITAHLLGIDPFDQPAVEKGKIRTRQYLSKLKVQC